jgi:hypothetical protein
MQQEPLTFAHTLRCSRALCAQQVARMCRPRIPPRNDSCHHGSARAQSIQTGKPASCSRHPTSHERSSRNRGGTYRAPNTRSLLRRRRALSILRRCTHGSTRTALPRTVRGHCSRWGMRRPNSRRPSSQRRTRTSGRHRFRGPSNRWGIAAWSNRPLPSPERNGRCRGGTFHAQCRTRGHTSQRSSPHP